MRTYFENFICIFSLFAGIYEVFCGHKNFAIGKQPEPFPGCPETVCELYIQLFFTA